MLFLFYTRKERDMGWGGGELELALLRVVEIKEQRAFL